MRIEDSNDEDLEIDTAHLAEDLPPKWCDEPIAVRQFIDNIVYLRMRRSP